MFVIAVLSFSTVYASGWREEFDDYNINPNYYAGSSSSYIIENSYIKAKWAVISVENQQNCPYFDGNFDTEFKVYVGNISGTVPILEHRVEKYGTLFHSIKIDGNRFLLTNYIDGTQKYSSPISMGRHHLHLIYDGFLALYVDGTKEITLPTSASYSSTNYIKFPVWNTSNVTWLDLIDIHPPVKEMIVSIESDKEYYLPEDEALLTVTVQDQDGKPLTGCTINETILYPDGTQEYNILDWTDHGDGTYTSPLELPQSGTYSIGVIVSKGGYTDGEASTEFEVLDAAAIAEAYKPYMHFYEGEYWELATGRERYFPTTIDLMLNNSTFWRLGDESPISEYNDASDKRSFISDYGEPHYIDLNPEGFGFYTNLISPQINDRDLYAHVALKEHEDKKYIVAQYWFHYIFNDHWNNHEGEWEMIEVLIDCNKFLQNGTDTIPEGAAYSRHLGGEYREWNDVEVRDTTHPVVYVAEGSHAAYFDEGLFGRSGISDIVGGSGEPEEPTSITTIENDPWLKFGGNWGYGATGSWPLWRDDGPKGPKHNSGGEKWYHPVEWAFDHQDNPPDPLPWQQYPGMISLSCPADMFITNSQGQITGTKGGEFIQEIPDSYVNSLGEKERYVVLMNDRYTIEIN
ncbi:MAG: Ig-like domain-containing protein, partial [Euryarchaeota archaeon]|nr:Ig-like domain-containing protein [Euryarchaeota archaeon]